jgi:hypothetical protein
MNNPPTTSKSLAAYYAVMAVTESAMQSCADCTTEPVEARLDKALVEIAALRLEVAALKADNAGLTKSLYSRPLVRK